MFGRQDDSTTSEPSSRRSASSGLLESLRILDNMSGRSDCKVQVEFLIYFVKEFFSRQVIVEFCKGEAVATRHCAKCICMVRHFWRDFKVRIEFADLDVQSGRAIGKRVTA